MEAEVRDILEAALGQDELPAKGLGTALRERFAPFGGLELDLPPRESIREPPTFD